MAEQTCAATAGGPLYEHPRIEIVEIELQGSIVAASTPSFPGEEF